MTNHGDDCYFYYYSTCTKGDSCPFRHCEAAMGSETVCNLWQENRCFRKICKFRHMEIQKKRNEIACYWENQPDGCQKPHCAFHHEKPRVIDGIFVPPSKVSILRKDIEEEPAPLADPSSPAPVPITNPANPQLRGVIKAETLENVPSPTHPPVVINPADDEDEDEDDQFSEEGEESSSRMVSPRKLVSSTNKDDSLNFGIKTLEEIRLRKALKANLKKAGQSTTSLSQGNVRIPPSGQHNNGSSGEKENMSSFIRPSQFTAKEDTPLQNEVPVKRHITNRLGKRKMVLPGEQNFSVKKDVPVVSELPLKRRLAERLGRKVEFPEDDADPLPQKAVKPVRDRLGLPAEPATSENESAGEAQASGEIQIKTLEEIRQAKAAKSQGPGTAATKALSPVTRSNKPPGSVRVKTFSEVLHAKKKQQQQEEEKEQQRRVAGEEQRKVTEEEQATDGAGGECKAPLRGDVPGKRAAQPSDVRVKTLEEIRKEKVARMQAKGQEVKAEETPASAAVLPKRRILRINKTTRAGAESDSNPNVPEATEKPAGPISTENGAANGKQDSPAGTVKVKTFQEIMQEKRLRKQQGEQGEQAAVSSPIPPDDPSPPSAPKQAPVSHGERPLFTLRQRTGDASQPAKPATQPEATPTAGRQCVALKQKEPDTAIPEYIPPPAAQESRAGSPSASAGGVKSPPAKRKGTPPAHTPAHVERTAPPSLSQEEPQVERMEGPAPKKSPVQTPETKVRPKLNVKPSVVKAASQVKLGQKRKAPESHRSAVAAVKPLNSTPSAVEDQSEEPSCKRADVKVPEAAAPSAGVEVEAQVFPLGPRLSVPAASSTSEAELHRTANAEQALATTEPILSPSKEPPASPQSSPMVKTPVQPKPRRQSTVTPRAAGSIALDDLDELMNEFADDPLDGELELDPAKDEDDLLLELSEMIDS
ncbi:hypothetical protein SKAU_G00170610 [Synaphobranchus kaupii]|uniref:C3H1-type domain-containing protein n=1 Tax=Synaphobranchus kaupii TaxID=118154 RepID=A0A9Q1FKG8_SYNKA|nr:hypothetical protein SKAU_G00170610 [Synaphobranchus kaupii]